MATSDPSLPSETKKPSGVSCRGGRKAGTCPARTRQEPSWGPWMGGKKDRKNRLSQLMWKNRELGRRDKPQFLFLCLIG